MTAKEYLLKELKGFGTEEEYQPKTVETISVFMEAYAEQQIKELEEQISKLNSIMDSQEDLNQKQFEQIAELKEMLVKLEGQLRIKYLEGVRDGSMDYSEQPWTDSDVRDLMDELETLKE